MTWKELLTWIDQNVTREEVIEAIGKGLGISTEPLAPSYKPALRHTNSGIAYYAANARNAKTVEAVWKKIQGTSAESTAPVQKKSPSAVYQEKQVTSSVKPMNQVSPFSGLRNSDKMFLCNHKKEYYRGEAKKYMEAMALFENRLYYIANEGSRNYKLYTSLEDGSDIRLLRELGDRQYGLSVNSEGIFLHPAAHAEGEKKTLKETQYGNVIWIGWDGTTKAEMNILQGCLAAWTEYIYRCVCIWTENILHIERNCRLIWQTVREVFSILCGSGV